MTYLSSRVGGSPWRLRLTRTLLLGLCLVGLASLAACGDDDDDAATAGSDEATDTAASEGDGEWAEIVAAAEEEGTVVVYGAKGPPIPDLITEGFEAAYDISLEYVDLGSGDQVERVDQELSVDKLGADFLLNSEILWQAELAKNGDIVSPDAFGPSKELWDQEFYADGLVQLAADPTAIVYNSDLVDEVPTDWDSLIDDKYKGRVGVMDASVATSTSMYYRMLLDTMGEGFLEDLAALEPQIHGGSSTLVQAVAAGELAWAPFGNAYTTRPLQAEGAPIEIAFPESGTSMVLMNGVVMSDAEHPNAALVLMDWLMSEDGQIAMNGEGKGLSRINAEGSLDGIDRDALRTLRPEDAETTEIDEINALFDRLFRQ